MNLWLTCATTKCEFKNLEKIIFTNFLNQIFNCKFFSFFLFWQYTYHRFLRVFNAAILPYRQIQNFWDSRYLRFKKLILQRVCLIQNLEVIFNLCFNNSLIQSALRLVTSLVIDTTLRVRPILTTFFQATLPTNKNC